MPALGDAYGSRSCHTAGNTVPAAGVSRYQAGNLRRALVDLRDKTEENPPKWRFRAAIARFSASRFSNPEFFLATVDRIAANFTLPAAPRRRSSGENTEHRTLLLHNNNLAQLVHYTFSSTTVALQPLTTCPFRGPRTSLIELRKCVDAPYSEAIHRYFRVRRSLKAEDNFLVD